VAVISYDLFFGSSNAGLAPSFSTFKNDATDAAITPPAITDKGGGFYRFSVDWSSVGGATAIRYAAGPLNGVELSDVLLANPNPGSVAVSGATQNLNLYETAGTIISRAAVQMGVSAAIADPYASTDPNVQQLCEFMRQAGDDMSGEHVWTHLTRIATFTTDGVTTSYALPADFYELVPQTLWNRSTRLPGMGPLSPQQIAVLQARLVNIVLNVTYNIAGGLLQFPIVPPSGSYIAFAYTSNYWVQSNGASSPDKDGPTASSDVLLFDPDVLLAALKLRYCEEKGIGDVIAAKARYDEKLERYITRNDPGPVISLGRGTQNPVDRMLDGRNIPEGNW